MKVLLEGYINNNLGDDLFLEFITARYPEVNFYLGLEPKFQKTFSENKNIKIIPVSPIKKYLNLFLIKFFKYRLNSYSLKEKFETRIVIGGSIFMQNNMWETELELFRRNLSAFSNTYILGCNFGPYYNQDYLDFYKISFKEVNDICFRDFYSYNLFNELNTVRYAPDVLFDLNMPKITTQKKIFISVIKPSFRKELVGKDLVYYNKIAEFCKFFISNGYKIVLSSFCKNEGDEEAITMILNLFEEDEKQYIEKKYYNGTNRIDIINEIASSEIVIATRFHAMILGWISNKKVLPIIYSNKTLNVIKDLKFKGDYVDIRNSIEYYKLNLANIGDLIDNISTIKEDSKLQFAALDKLLN